MPYLTDIPASLVSVGVGLPDVVSIPNTSVLNSFGPAQQITGYNVNNTDVGGTGSATLNYGDFLAPIVGGSPVPGTYLGTGTISNTAINLGNTANTGFPNLNLGVSITLNPVAVQYFQDESGNIFSISDQPLTQDHLSVNLVVKLPGGNATTTTVPLNQLTATLGNIPLLGPLLAPLGDVTQNILSTAIITETSTPNGVTTIPPGQINDIVCFARGTLIETANGPVAVEDLAEGDMIVTRDHGPQPLRWISSTKLSPAELAANQHLLPIRIQAGALGNNVPSTDLLVSPQHRVLIRSAIAQRMFGTAEVLVAAKQLVMLDGVDIADDLVQIEYFHFLFDQHEVVISNGAETESLFTGPQALKAVGPAARAEIEALFPELLAEGAEIEAARPLVSGRKGRKLAMRHKQHDKALVM